MLVWDWLHTQPEHVLGCVLVLSFVCTHWIVCGVFLLCDVANAKWGWFAKLKIPPHNRTSKQLIKKLALNVIANQLTTVPMVFWLLWQPVKYRLNFSQQLPSLSEALCHMFGFIIVAEIVFFSLHWSLHLNTLYKHIHKVHHEVKTPIALAGFYFHPVEHAISAAQGLAGPIVFGSHYMLALLWVIFATSFVLIHHSGYDLDSIPVFGSLTVFHDIHHKLFDVNFGVLGVLDLLFGTLHAPKIKIR